MGVAALAGVALHVYLARELQPELYGVLAVVTSIIIWWELSGAALVRQATERAVAAAGDAWRGVVGTSVRTTVVWGLGLMIACELTAPAIASALGDPQLTSYIRLMALGIPLWILWSVWVAILNGRRRYGLRALSVAGYWVAKALLMCGLVALGFSVKGAIAGSIGASVVGLATAWWMAGVGIPAAGLPVRELVSFGLPLMGLAIVNQLILSMDLWFVKGLLPDADAAGHYGIARYAFHAAIMLSGAVCGAMFPTLTGAVAAGNRASIRELIGESARFVLILLTPMIAIMACCGREIIGLVFGQAYEASATAVVVLLIAALLFGMRLVGDTSLIAAGRPRTVLLALAPMLPVNVALNYLLVPTHGLLGAAGATVLTLVIAAALVWWLTWRQFRVLPSVAVLARTAVAAAAVYGVGLLVPAGGWLVLMKAAGLAGLYLLLLAVLGELRLRDVEPLLFWRGGTPPQSRAEAGS